MLIEVEGDILKSKAEAIVHGVAPNDHFQHGLALSLREQWPALAKDFRHYCQTQHPKPGTLWIWKGVGGPAIVNLCTQEGAFEHGALPGKASLENVNHCLRELHKEVEKEGYKSIAITRLATGVGGLKWDDVKPLVEKHLGHLKIPVYMYVKYHAGQVANEKPASIHTH